MSTENEAAYSSESQVEPRVLEIGYGTSPAYRAGGELFKGQVEYVGVDLPPSYDGDLENHNPNLTVTGVMANVAHLPFADATFDLALARSFFGQPMPTAKEFGDIMVEGIEEVFRVLKPDGQLVVAEENTPLRSELMVPFLERAGFEIACIAQEQNYRMSDFGNENVWLALRDKYFRDRPIQTDDISEVFGYPYILIAKKPVPKQ